jgi:hypothetical protein
MIPKEVLIKRYEEHLGQILARPLMYGGDWNGVEVAILSTLFELDFARKWPEKQSENILGHWCQAIHATYRGGNTTLAQRLEYDGIIDREHIRLKYVAAVEKYLELHHA